MLWQNTYQTIPRAIIPAHRWSPPRDNRVSSHRHHQQCWLRDKGTIPKQHIHFCFLKSREKQTNFHSLPPAPEIYQA